MTEPTPDRAEGGIRPATEPQSQQSIANKKAWSHRAYEATVRLGGTPDEAAIELREDPEYTLRAYRRYLGDVEGKKIANLLGSTGKKAVALALLGAKVTIVDISEENQRYALELANAAGVAVEFVISDVLEWRTDHLEGHFDLVLMELGILHYFVDLVPLAQVTFDVLAPGARVVLHESHPFVRKLAPRQDGERLVLDGDYFSREIVNEPAPRVQMAFREEESGASPQCCYRYWQMGEAVTAFASRGLIVEALAEVPHGDFSQLPGTFSLVARKDGPTGTM